MPDANPTDKKVICYVLMAMPKSFDNMTTEFVKNRLTEKNKKDFQEEVKRKKRKNAVLTEKRDKKYQSAETYSKGKKEIMRKPIQKKCVF